MKKIEKSTKIIFILMIFVIIFMIGLFLVYYYLNSNKTILAEDDIIQNMESENNKLTDNLTYEKIDENGTYEIYDESGNCIDIVYSESELEFYKENPDYNPTFGVYQEAEQDAKDLEENQE